MQSDGVVDNAILQQQSSHSLGLFHSHGSRVPCSVLCVSSPMSPPRHEAPKALEAATKEAPRQHPSRLLVDTADGEYECYYSPLLS